MHNGNINLDLRPALFVSDSVLFNYLTIAFTAETSKFEASGCPVLATSGLMKMNTHFLYYSCMFSFLFHLEK